MSRPDIVDIMTIEFYNVFSGWMIATHIADVQHLSTSLLR